MRRLQGKPPCSDLFGVKGRAWLRSRQLPVEESETVQAALRHIAFLDREIEAVERLIAKQMLNWPEAKRLMTMPGVNPIAAATFLAAIGEISRFSSSRRLVALPRIGSEGPPVRRAGRPPGPDLKRGSASARWALVEAAWTVVNQPGPLRAFYQRVKARRGHGNAIVAAARKLAVLLSRQEDYAHQQSLLTAQKLRRLELTAGAPVRKGKPLGAWVTHQKMRQAEKQLTERAQASHERTVALASSRSGQGSHAEARGSRRERDTGARLVKSLKREQAPRRGPQAPDVCAPLRRSLARPQPNASA